jgi:hypothetical protein
MAELMFKDQNEIDAFDEDMWDIEQMFKFGILTTDEAINIVQGKFGHSELMARRCVELWMPEKCRTVTNVY